MQRAQYEADLAQLRYMRVDPNNRLVADTLETQWNEKLRLLTQAKEECEKQQRQDGAQLSADQQAKILALARDFPRMWQDPKTSDRERKRMARLLLEDVTLRRGQEITVQVRFKGGATKELCLPLPQPATILRRTRSEIITEMRHDTIDDLVARHLPPKAYAEQWDVEGLTERVKSILGLDLPIAEWAAEDARASLDDYDRVMFP